MSDSVDRVFVHALNTVKRIPRTGTARPPAAERLALYGLYKQSMEGDVEGVMDRPIGNTSEVQAECEKWDAWYAQRDMSRTEAKRRYISTLIDTMHQYASQTPEARELVSELEFVWDQIKFNAPSSSGSSPLNTVGVPPLSRSAYGSTGGRLAAQSEESHRPDRRDDASRRDRDSRLRVLSPVSQPEEEAYYRRGRGPVENDEDEDEEEFEEARDSLYEERDQEDHDNDNDNPDHASSNSNTNTHTHTHTDVSSHHRSKHRRNPASGISIDSSGNGLPHRRDSHPNSQSEPPKDSRWRCRVEQALTKMTAEIAAVREQMEARSVAQRRRSGMFAWLKWLIWVAARQILFDIAMLGMLLIWMRLRGDRRVELWLKTGWAAVKAKLANLKRLKVVDMPILP
ncbi:FERM/acyl-CoA-binding protein, 3-helical bundle [Penicillium italicum]|uniref:FERM/acyl-CoA-binding protein, 3-helical bundle n=1 Tax=Penicillium italicum TaxID=40296 RepID=A0A0A2L7X0_PENIT|nr:FERM/acyl-CoA-binding protein, 3-helical bundle [Penicillium italicum]